MKKDNYMELNFKDIAHGLSLNRREFIKLSGGGIFVFFTIGDFWAYAQERRGGPSYPADFNAYLRIGEDGRVTCYSGKIEMGQGVITSLAQELADELDVSLDSIDMVMGDTDLCPWDMGTFGSMSTRFFGPALRAAGAEAKAVLLELASEQLNLPKENLTVTNGVIFHKTNKNIKVSYSQLTKGKRIERHLEGKSEVKKESEFKVMGRSVNRLDGFEKVTGKAKYAGDVQFPDMLYAKIVRPPAHDAKLVSIDISGAEGIEGIQIIQEGDLTAVLHKYPDVAEMALTKIKTQYNKSQSKIDHNTIFEHLLSVAPEGNPVSQAGDLLEGEKRSSKVVEKNYYDGYVAHSAIETHTAVGKMEGDKITLWASTQTPFPAQNQVAEALGLPPENVRIITPFVGGGFGGKTYNQQIIEAAKLTKLTGKTVQVAWSRAEEFFYDTFRPAAIVKIKTGLTDNGKIALWDYHVYFAGERGAQHFYNIPHYATIAHGSGWRGTPGSHPFSTGAWRAPSNNTNTFARESQIDIMAADAKMDPLKFRLNNLTDLKMSAVLRQAAEKFGYTPANAPSKRGFGIACGIDAGTYVATIVEVEVNQQNGAVNVKRVVCAQDMGLVINPEGATIQMEGCISMGLGYALTEDIHFRGGEIFDLNFDTYELPRFSSLPQIETVIVESDDPNPQGGGEPAIITMGGAIANAIYDATGCRVYQLPMTSERVKAALEKG